LKPKQVVGGTWSVMRGEWRVSDFVLALPYFRVFVVTIPFNPTPHEFSSPA
jgi:hypothetical protein